MKKNHSQFTIHHSQFTINPHGVYPETSKVSNEGDYFLGINAYNSIITRTASSGFNGVGGSGALSGTTGTDGKINIRDNAGALNIENRTGSSGLNAGWTAFGSD